MIERAKDYLNIPPTMRQWVLRELPDTLRCVDPCRLDLLGERLGTLRILGSTRIASLNIGIHPWDSCF